MEKIVTNRLLIKSHLETLLYGRDSLSSEDVRKALTQKDIIDSQFAQMESKDSNDALIVKESNKNKRSMTCNFSKQSDESKSAKSSSAEVSYVESEDYDVGALVVTSEYKGDDSWILDSGCSRHMTFNFSFFSTNQKVDGRKVTMDNEASCPILGVGDVKFIMFNGVVRTLTEVLYVPGMNRNLISLSILDKEGFRCIGEGRVLKRDDEDDDTSLSNESSRIIPTYPNKSMGCMDLIELEQTKMVNVCEGQTKLDIKGVSAKKSVNKIEREGTVGERDSSLQGPNISEMGSAADL
ncbi:uncharacterized protein LOC130799287 [Amaranthus tricolor]|uniref:uncharacterized protein LOC130799287 n=1 Tax=Amaranthus tricolor TaxID=29722 RepID=UPI002584447C|nr:uncharacterized protein LOC130799287 [Amaranthus tricolor]